MPTIAMSSISVRDASGLDYGDVVRLLAAANAQYEPALPPPVYRAYLDDVLDVHSRLADSDLLVAEQDGGIVGAVTFYPDASREKQGWPSHWAGIRAVAVHPRCRGQGIGRLLVAECIDRARRRRVEAVCLHTAAFMGAAVRLYEGLGFRRIPEYDRDLGQLFPGSGLGRITAIAYRLRLDDRDWLW